MSKAEEAAFKAYPFIDGKMSKTQNANAGRMYARNIFKNGYEQAEKDLELTWEDMAFIRMAFDALEASIHLGAIKIQPMTKEYYQEVLKRFKNMKK